MNLLRLPLLLLALSLPVTTSYGRVYSLSPHLGDVGGGMRVNLTGRDFVDYGDVRCRFGTNAWTRATVDTATSMHCLTPANFSDQLLFPLASPSGRVDVPVEVTFNGVTWSSSDTWFAFYDLGYTRISRIEPAGGPTSGDTAVTVHGRHLRGPPGPAGAPSCANAEATPLAVPSGSSLSDPRQGHRREDCPRRTRPRTRTLVCGGTPRWAGPVDVCSG